MADVVLFALIPYICPKLNYFFHKYNYTPEFPYDLSFVMKICKTNFNPCLTSFKMKFIYPISFHILINFTCGLHPMQLISWHLHNNRLVLNWLFSSDFHKLHELNREQHPHINQMVHINYQSILVRVLCMLK